jgi:AhpD family alkylhydroperoxidase
MDPVGAPEDSGSTEEPRLVALLPDALDAEQRALYDVILDGPRARGPRAVPLTDERGALNGPFNAFLLSPRLGMPLQQLGAAIRFATTLPDRSREVAILVVAAHTRCAYEQYAHEAIGRRVGLDEDALSAIRGGRHDDLEDADAEIARLARVLLIEGDLDATTYRAAVLTLGVERLFELVTLVGYYSTLATQLKVFRVRSPDD